MAWTMRCETCVHWEPPDDFDREHNGGRGRCLQVVHEDETAVGALAAVTDYDGTEATCPTQ